MQDHLCIWDHFCFCGIVVLQYKFDCIDKHTEHDMGTLLTWQVWEENLQQFQRVSQFTQQNKWSVIVTNMYWKYKWIHSNHNNHRCTTICFLIKCTTVIVRNCLHCRHVESTGGLHLVLQVTVNKQCDIIANISIDGLLNGAHCCIKYIHENSKSHILSVIWA